MTSIKNINIFEGKYFMLKFNVMYHCAAMCYHCRRFFAGKLPLALNRSHTCLVCYSKAYLSFKLDSPFILYRGVMKMQTIESEAIIITHIRKIGTHTDQIV